MMWGVLVDGDPVLVAGSACKARASAWSTFAGMGDLG